MVAGFSAPIVGADHYTSYLEMQPDSTDPANPPVPSHHAQDRSVHRHGQDRSVHRHGQSEPAVLPLTSAADEAAFFNGEPEMTDVVF